MVFLFKILLLSLMCFASDAGASKVDQFFQKSLRLNLSQDPQWLLLLHEHQNIFGFYQSEITGTGFFLSPNGSTDPRAELQSDLEALFDNKTQYKDINDNPICLIKARQQWLQKKLNIPQQDLVKKDCPLYDRYMRILNPGSVSFVFSAYYTNNPGSAFGHTFFRINKKSAEQKSSELLDHGIGYAADATTSNPVLYALYGFTGGFRGTFTNVPYYYKVREYNDFESRDLWSYDLNLTEPEISLLVDHIWELGNTSFNYYFLTQNCAFEMNAILEAAAPRYQLLKKTSYFVIPADAVKTVMNEQGLVKKISYRAAAKKVFLNRYQNLSESEKLRIKTFSYNYQLQDLVSNINDASKAKVLDAAIDLLDYKYPSLEADPKNLSSAIKQEVLAARAGVPLQSPEFFIEQDPKERPDLSHPSARIDLSYGRQDNVGSFEQMGYRFSLHDLLDEPTGYPKSELELGYFKARYNNDSRSFYLTDAELFRVAAYNPINTFDKKLSWRVSLNGRRFDDGSCDYCFAEGLDFAVGVTNEIFNSDSLLYLLASGQSFTSPGFDRGYKLSVGPALGIFILSFKNIRLNTEAAYFYQLNPLQKDELQIKSELRMSMDKNKALGLQHLLIRDKNQLDLAVYYYF